MAHVRTGHGMPSHGVRAATTGTAGTRGEPPAARPPAHVTLIGGTGSATLIDTGTARVLVDCGHDTDLSRLDVPCLDAVVLTHAHIGHTGRLADLARHGFTGPVVATPETLRLAAAELLDAERLRREYEGVDTPGPFRGVLPAGARSQTYGAVTTVAPGVTCRLRRAGHTLGSAWVHLDLAGFGSVVLTGDLGRPGHPLLRPPDAFDGADLVLVDSVRAAAPGDADSDEDDVLARAVSDTLRRDGTVLIPAGPVDRVAAAVHALARLRTLGRIPDHVSVHIDAPTGLDVLDAWRDAVRTRHADLTPGALALGPAAFAVGPVTAAVTPEASRRLIAGSGPRVVVAGPAACGGGRVEAHLRRLLPDQRNAVLLIGETYPGTPARALADGCATLHAAGDTVPVRAGVVRLPGMTTHADVAEVVAWLGTADAGTTRVVHGDRAATSALCDGVRTLLGREVGVAAPGTRLHLSRG